MKKFRHKQSRDQVVELVTKKGYYQSIFTETVLPGKYIENTNDWEEIKQPLFTTEDGVEIFEGDTKEIFFIHKNNDFSVKSTLKRECKLGSFSNNVLYFSTKKSAENYIKMNKPCLSLKDVFSVYPEYKTREPNIKTKHAEEIIKIVKERM